MGRHWSTEEGRQVSTLRKKWEAKEKYPKCVPLAKATRMTKGQKAGAVRRKRAAGNPGPKPTNVATFAKKEKIIMVRGLKKVAKGLKKASKTHAKQAKIKVNKKQESFCRKKYSRKWN